MIKEYAERLYVPAARNAGAIDAEWPAAQGAAADVAQLAPIAPW